MGKWPPFWMYRLRQEIVRILVGDSTFVLNANLEGSLEMPGQGGGHYVYRCEFTHPPHTAEERGAVRRIDNVDIRILGVISDHIKEHSFPPSFREIAERLGMKKPTVYGRCRKMLDLGAIRWEKGQERTMVLTRQGRIRLDWSRGECHVQ